MLEVDWRTGVGYGDFVTGLGYAHTASLRYLIPVKLTLYWDHSEDYLFSNKDTETIVDRCKYIQSIMRPNPLVEVHHVFNSRLPYRFKNQLDEFNPLHGLWYSTLLPKKSNTVVLWSSRHNETFPGYDKDPAYDYWPVIAQRIGDMGYNVVEVTYRTPISNVIRLINECEFGIGYDGLAHQLFKFMWKPLIVCCKRVGLNKLLIPQAHIVDDPTILLNGSIEDCAKRSISNLNQTKVKHQQYINDKQDHTKHRLFNTIIY